MREMGAPCKAFDMVQIHAGAERKKKSARRGAPYRVKTSTTFCIFNSGPLFDQSSSGISSICFSNSSGILITNSAIFGTYPVIILTQERLQLLAFKQLYISSSILLRILV